MKKKRGLGCLVVGTLVLIGLCAVAAGFSWWRFSTREPRILVEIPQPQEGTVANINEPLPLVVSAEADKPIARLEVYADGTLIAASNGDGQNALFLAQTWTPRTAGRHVLVARAFLTAEQFADSQIKYIDSLDLSQVPVQINIDNIPRADGITEVKVDDLAAAAGTTPEEIARLNPGLVPGGVVPAGSVVSLPRRPSTPGGSAGTPGPGPGPGGAGEAPIPAPPPGGPGLAPPSPSDPIFEGETHSCSQIAMRWRDAADETAYKIYRVQPGEVTMTQIATLPANTTTYNDTPVTRIGTYRYFLAPVRRGGEGITSMLTVEIAPDCSPAGSETTNLRLSLLSLTTAERYEGVYCYVSVNGSRYERLPAGDGLLRPTSGGLYYDLPLQIPNRGQYVLSPTSAGRVILEGECWGRRGAESLRIGRFSGSHTSSEWDGRDLMSDLAFEPFSVASLSDVPALAGGANFLRYRIAPVTRVADIIPSYNGVIQLPADVVAPIRREVMIPAPTNVQIVNYSLGLCDMLPFGDPNLRTAICDGLNIRQLTWEYQPGPLGPQPTGFMIITSIEDTFSPTPAGEGFVTNVNSGTARSAPVPDYSLRWRCGATVRFSVRAVTALGMSEPSQPFEVRLPACQDVRNMIITVESLTISPSASSGKVLDEGDICIFCDDRRFELFGTVKIDQTIYRRGGREAELIDLAIVLNPVGALPAVSAALGGCPIATFCVKEGTLTPMPVLGWPIGPSAPRTFAPPWRQIQPVLTNRPLELLVALDDADLRNASDPFCMASKVLPARSAQEWARANETVILESDFGEAKCTFKINVRGE